LSSSPTARLPEPEAGQVTDCADEQLEATGEHGVAAVLDFADGAFKPAQAPR
jgi:hypothetical protein